MATYIPPFPLRVLKEEPCADVRRPLHWAARRSRSLGPRPGGVANPPNGESRGTFTRTHRPRSYVAPARGVRSVTKAARCRDRPCRTSHPWPGSRVPCACSAWPGRGRSAQVVLSGVQKGQIAHLGRQKPPESELAVAAHGGASQRHTTGAVYGRLRTSWDGDGPCGLNLSVGGHTVQNKTNKTNGLVSAWAHMHRARS